MHVVHCFKSMWTAEDIGAVLSIKGGSNSSVSRVIGGGPLYADDKVIQRNGNGTVVIDGFFAQDFGKLYRSCGNCKSNPRQRFLNADLTVIHSNRAGKNVSIVVMNGNCGDQAVLRNIYVKPTTARFTECASSYDVNQSGVKSCQAMGQSFPLSVFNDDIHIIKSGREQEQQEQQE
ncbi:LOW QUALITY PROTEIN: Polysaccharide lyase [Phytophthora palmivora]|uniref:Probable pectate lyase F n=1 Tax=Phytophthora palmivora TaxID=4796 RepID=A0A2P4YAP8_9STRA|nr:LOW QUALITY PROTEIN: Polysaccharide lyase [Phytophthora palmivora]